MCVRCAQSTIIDFTIGNPNTGLSLNQIIHKKLNKISSEQSEQKPRPMVFMAGYSKDYRSELRGSPMDSFERHIPEPGEKPLPCDVTVGKPYTECAIGAGEQMIYHVKLADSNVQGEAKKSVSPMDEEDDEVFLSLFG